MDLQLKGKTALVGGGSKGLGYGAALCLAREGVSVAICARGGEDLERAVDRLQSETSSRVVPIEYDLSETKRIKEKVIDVALAELGSVDILVANSGGPAAGEFADLTEDSWEYAYRAVFLYVKELYQHIIPLMKEKKWGRIINIASLSVKEPAPSLVLSNVYRSAVLSLAKSISQDLIGSNITINSLLPGAFLTDRAKHLLALTAKKSGKTIEEVTLDSIRNLPLGRFQTPEELGAVVAFLSSEVAGGITGLAIPLDGGLSKGFV